MSFKPFYVHLNPFRPGRKLSSRVSRGATLLVTPVDNDSSVCAVQVAFCNPKDQFCKAIGRQEAVTKEVHIVPKVQLPSKVGEVYNAMLGYPPALFGGKQYNYLYRNFIN